MNSVEIWKDIKGYKDFYQISNLGRVRSLDRVIPHKRHGYVKRKGLLLKPFHNREYKIVVLQKNSQTKNYYIHRLVAEAFIPNLENKPCVCHKDDKPKNNSINNLFWGTHQDNMDDKKRKNRHIQGEHPSRRAIICNETGELFYSRNEASKKLKIARSSISQILRGVQNSTAGYSFRYLEIS